jgi:hypothetical protein
VVNTGGGVFCRTWRSIEELPSKDEETTYYEVMYGDEFGGVEVGKWSKEKGGVVRWEGSETVEAPSEKTDPACAELARELMEQYPDGERA